MPKYLTPGVYINENVLLPPRITAAPTYIAAFIGYTERHQLDEQSLLNTPIRIRSLLEFEQFFGGDAKHKFDVDAAKSGQATDVKLATKGYIVSQSSPNFLLYRSLCMFFKNGGEECTVVSVGSYHNGINVTSILAGLAAIKGEARSSIIAIPDIVALDNVNECTFIQQTLLSQCSQDTYKRFAILDIFQGYSATSSSLPNDCINEFRNKITGADLSYAAAYYPWLVTTVINNEDLGFSLFNNIPSVRKLLSLELTKIFPRLNRQAIAKQRKIQFLIDSIADEDLSTLSQVQRNEQQQAHQTLLTLSPFYSLMLQRIIEKLNLLPPSGAVCGSYSMVDRNRGVWKAPANVALSSVISPCQALNNEQQQWLNVDPSGKSVNVIRSFISKGVLIWGARTLAGDNNEWRYINVRRTIMMIEVSVLNGLKAVVGEPNDHNLWSKSKVMIETFLTQLWQAGALVGAKPEQAYFVKIGLNNSMTNTDILEGRLIVQLGIAMVRPAEFIVRKVEQKMAKP